MFGNILGVSSLRLREEVLELAEVQNPSTFKCLSPAHLLLWERVANLSQKPRVSRAEYNEIISLTKNLCGLSEDDDV